MLKQDQHTIVSDSDPASYESTPEIVDPDNPFIDPASVTIPTDLIRKPKSDLGHSNRDVESHERALSKSQTISRHQRQLGSSSSGRSSDSDSSSSSSGQESDDGQDYGESGSTGTTDWQPRDHAKLHELQLRLERQFVKQSRYLYKCQQIHHSIHKTTRRITRLTRHLTARRLIGLEMRERRPSPIFSPPSLPPNPTGVATRPLLTVKSESSPGIILESPPPLRECSPGEGSSTGLKLYSRALSKSRTLGAVAQADARPSTLKPTESRRFAEQQITLATEERCDVYLRRYQFVNKDCFLKKPRSLLYNIADDDTKDIMVTSSLAGDLQFWNASTRKNIKSVSRSHLYDSWIEEMCWATPHTLALCPATKAPRNEPASGVGQSVKLVHIKSASPEIIEGRVQTLNIRPHVSNKQYTTIASIDLGPAYTQRQEHAQFATGGTDKSVYLWQLRRDRSVDDFSVDSVTRLKIKHTNTVQAICHSRFHDRLFTGGADAHLFGVDLQTHATVLEYKMFGRINHIHSSATTPNLMLVNLSMTHDQFAIYDQRCSGLGAMRLRFGYTETENLSRYLRADWHQNGYMVACGSQSEPQLHVWDIRYIHVRRGPCFSLATQDTSRILRTLFLPSRNTLVSISSARSMTWTDYGVEHDAVLHPLP